MLVLRDVTAANDHAAASILGAFVHQVQAQRGKKIPADDADALIDAARWIVDQAGWEAPGLSSRMAHGRIPAA